MEPVTGYALTVSDLNSTIPMLHLLPTLELGVDKQRPLHRILVSRKHLLSSSGHTIEGKIKSEIQIQNPHCCRAARATRSAT